MSRRLYLRAISRASEGIVSILAAGAADYSDYRKTMMMGSIYLFGMLALPFAGLTDKSYGHLNALSTLYVIISTVSGVYTIIEASYIPIFMRSAGWLRPRARLQDELPRPEHKSSGAWIKGSRVSVLGLLSSNVGALLALLIGVIITYSRGNIVKEGYHKSVAAPDQLASAANQWQFPFGRHHCGLYHEYVARPLSANRVLTRCPHSCLRHCRPGLAAKRARGEKTGRQEHLSPAAAHL